MKTILVAVDFSDVTPRLVDTAVTLARALGSKLHLVHVAAPEPDFVGYEAGPPGVRNLRAKELRQEHRELGAMAREIEGAGVECQTHLVEGATVETIVKTAADKQADLVIIGSHGHGALYHALVGSVGQGVLREATCPVLVVPDPHK